VVERGVYPALKEQLILQLLQQILLLRWLAIPAGRMAMLSSLVDGDEPLPAIRVRAVRPYIPAMIPGVGV